MARNWEYDWFDDDDNDEEVWALVALDLLLYGSPIFCCCTFEFRSNGVISVFLILFGGVLMGQGRVIGWIFCSLPMFRSETIKFFTYPEM